MEKPVSANSNSLAGQTDKLCSRDKNEPSVTTYWNNSGYNQSNSYNLHMYQHTTFAGSLFYFVRETSREMNPEPDRVRSEHSALCTLHSDRSKEQRLC